MKKPDLVFLTNDNKEVIEKALEDKKELTCE